MMSSDLWHNFLAGQIPTDLLIIDAHTHMGSLAEFHVAEGGKDVSMLRVMDRLGIRVAVSAPFAAWAGELREGHEEVAAAARRYPGRFLGYCVYNPAHGVERSMAELQRWLDDPRFVGIKIAPSTHGYRADDPAYRPMWELANQRSLPVLTHSWHGTPEDDPSVFGPIAREYQDARILLGHSGGVVEGMRTAIEVARHSSNVYLELASSRLPFRMLEVMVREVGAERILYGSDMPFIDPRWKLGQVLGARIADSAKEKILGGNALEVFRLRLS